MIAGSLESLSWLKGTVGDEKCFLAVSNSDSNALNYFIVPTSIGGELRQCRILEDELRQQCRDQGIHESSLFDVVERVLGMNQDEVNISKINGDDNRLVFHLKLSTTVITSLHFVVMRIEDSVKVCLLQKYSQMLLHSAQALKQSNNELKELLNSKEQVIDMFSERIKDDFGPDVISQWAPKQSVFRNILDSRVAKHGITNVNKINGELLNQTMQDIVRYSAMSWNNHEEQSEVKVKTDKDQDDFISFTDSIEKEEKIVPSFDQNSEDSTDSTSTIISQTTASMSPKKRKFGTVRIGK